MSGGEVYPQGVEIVGYRGCVNTGDPNNPTLSTAVCETKREATTRARKLGRAAGYNTGRQDVSASPVFGEGEEE